MSEKRIITTVKIRPVDYDDFKVLGIRHKNSLQTFVEKCIMLFNSDPSYSGSFRQCVLDYSPQVLNNVSGSI